MKLSGKKLKGVDGQLDDAWSKLVKLRAGNQCEYCGKRSYVQSHHIFSRGNKATRWDVQNGVALCAGHHTLSAKFSAHKTPTEFHIWLEEKKGEEFISILRIKANGVSKLHEFEKKVLLEELRREIKQIEKLIENGEYEKRIRQNKNPGFNRS